MATIHEKSPVYASTRKAILNLFKTYDISIEITKYKLIKVTDTEAQVRCTQTSKKTKGPAYKDNETIAVHTLKKSNGKWKIFNSKLEKVDFIDE